MLKIREHKATGAEREESAGTEKDREEPGKAAKVSC